MEPSVFANPWGALGLLAAPAIVAIHFLRQRSRKTTVSTLFLLENVAPKSRTGHRWERLENSLPFWMQLLAVLLGTWLLVQPRWLRSDSLQRVNLVLDSTASMRACRGEVLTQLPAVLGRIADAAAHTEWTLRTTAEPERSLYRGRDLRALLDTLGSWQPSHPAHSPDPALLLAALAQRGARQSVVLLVSDHDAPLPAGAGLLAFGRPVANAGFVGSKITRDKDAVQFEALVRNASASPQERRWWIETAGGRLPGGQLQMAPGEIAVLRGVLPEPRAELRLDPDAFPLDDRLPLVAPVARPLTVFASGSVQRLAKRLVETVPGARLGAAESGADVVFSKGPAAGERAGVFFAGETAAAPLAGGLIAEHDALMEGLVWEGLLYGGAGALEPLPADRVLLWQGTKPLIWLHGEGLARQLWVNFDPATSNADRLPSMVLLLGRFLAEIQAAKPDRWADNFETHQALPLPGAESLRIRAEAGGDPRPAGALRAPEEPGFFSVVSPSGEVRLEGAACFGDPRESDFSQAVSAARLPAGAERAPDENLLPDPFADLWLVLLGGALLLSWALPDGLRRSVRPAAPERSPSFP
jgi:hypothetical protein